MRDQMKSPGKNNDGNGKAVYLKWNLDVHQMDGCSQVQFEDCGNDASESSQSHLLTEWSLFCRQPVCVFARLLVYYCHVY